MDSFLENIKEYKKQMEKGAVQAAYKGLMKYIMDLKTYFKTRYPEYFVSGSIYYGYMDMTYFSFFPEVLKERKLKVAVVFLHDKFRFEVWLAGYNKQIQKKFWNLMREKNWKKYRLVTSLKGSDSIAEHILADNPDFSNLDNLTKTIEKRILMFIQDIVSFLSDN
ncbi:MAG: hypothetical protein GX556_02525 [Fibrobacter sp.]|nr:hypothetical protein [Fibrobacter sp.]